MVKAIQLDFEAKESVSNSLRKLARRGLISEVDFRIYPICSQILA